MRREIGPRLISPLMATISVILIVLIVALISNSVQANMQCGLKPFPPIGCGYDSAVCVCDEYGCRWVFVGCG